MLRRLRHPNRQRCRYRSTADRRLLRAPPPSPGTGEGLRSKAQGEGATAAEAHRPSAPCFLSSARSIVSRAMKDRIVIRGARQHNLKNLDLDLPRRSVIVVTGPSGSGKSSLAFDTVYAEGQRRYVESHSTYAKQ